jgi:heterodisulfide reductase subunit A
VVLATGIVPRSDVKDIVNKLRISQSADGFLFEAHPKLQPLDSFTTGIFLAGCAQGPKDIPDTVAQASGAASRACSVISKDHLDISAVVAQIDADKCTACLTCVRVCPYHVPMIDPEEGIAVIEAAKCQGCGTCAGECPAKAIVLKHYLDEQIIAKCDALLSAHNSGGG